MNLNNKGLFTIEGWEKNFEGYSNPKENWNGWACPRFEAETVMQVLEQADCVENITMHTLTNGSTIICYYDVEDKEIILLESSEFNTLSGKKMLFEVGTYGWCWEGVNCDPERSTRKPKIITKNLPVFAIAEKSEEERGMWKVLLQKNGVDSDWWCIFGSLDKNACEDLAFNINQAMTKFQS